VKLLRTYAMQMEALQRYRGKGEQKMTVEHVHVYQGHAAAVPPRSVMNSRRCMSAPSSGDSIVPAQTSTLIGAETGIESARHWAQPMVAEGRRFALRTLKYQHCHACCDAHSTSEMGHFRQINPLPTLSACPLRSDRVRTLHRSESTRCVQCNKRRGDAPRSALLFRPFHHVTCRDD